MIEGLKVTSVIVIPVRELDTQDIPYTDEWICFLSDPLSLDWIWTAEGSPTSGLRASLNSTNNQE